MKKGERGRIDFEGHWYEFEYRSAKDRTDICLATKDPYTYCNGFYLYSTKDEGNGLAFVITNTNNNEMMNTINEKLLAYNSR